MICCTQPRRVAATSVCHGLLLQQGFHKPFLFGLATEQRRISLRKRMIEKAAEGGGGDAYGRRIEFRTTVGETVGYAIRFDNTVALLPGDSTGREHGEMFC